MSAVMLKRLRNSLRAVPSRPIQHVRMWLRNPVSSLSPIVIMGCPRSGTTLIKTLLVANPELCGTEWESTGIFRVRDFDRYSMVELPDDVIAGFVHESPHVVTLYEKVVGRILEDRQLNHFVDKVSIRRWRLRFLNRHLPNARYVNIIRDGRDTLCSARRHPDVWQSQTTASFARYWKECVTLPQLLLADRQLISIRYEDLTADPEGTLRKVMTFLGVEFHDCQLDPVAYRPQIATVDVHQNLSKSVNTSSVQRWRSDLSAEDQSLFLELAGEQLDQWSYQLR